MAITRAQQVRQMLEDGGMLVSPSTTGKRPGYRSAKAQEVQGRTKTSGFSAPSKPGQSPRGTTTSRDDDVAPGYNPNTGRFEKPDGTPEVARTPKEVQQSLDAAIAQGKFKKKNPIEKFFDNYTKGTRKTLYSVFPNNPTNELDYLRSLPVSQRALLSPALRAKLEALELDEDQDLLDTANTKFTFDEFEELRKFQPTDDTLNFAEYAAKFKGAPGLLYSGDVGNLKKIKNPDGTFSYERDYSQDDPILFPQGTTPGDPNQDPGDGGGGDNTPTGGMAFRFLSRGGSPMDAPTEGGIMDLESGRQMYFLGKLVKKASRALKKITKSPLGKAALLGGAMYFGGGGAGGFRGLLEKGLLKKGATDFTLANLSPMKAIGLTSLASSLFAQEEDEDDDMLYRGPSIDPGYIRRNPYTFASQIGSGSGIATAFAADGGRIGLKDGNGVADEEAENAKFVKRVRELMDEGFDMGEAVKEAMKEGYAEGGRTGFYMGSKFPQGLALVRQMLKFFSEGSKTGKTGSQLLKIVNPKQFTKYLEDPNTLFMKGSTKDGIMASDVVKDYASKVKGERAKMIEDLLESAKNINKANKSTEKFKKEIIEEMISKGSNKEAAESSAEILSSIAESAAGGKEIMKYKPKITEEGILQLEQIVKNLQTGGKTARDLNAQGGRIGLKGGTGSKILKFFKPFGRDTKGGNQLEGLLYGSEGIAEILKLLSSSGMFAEGGDVEPVAKKTMPLLDMDGKEMDLREEGGFVPIGRMEKADDVPARLSKNEFVFTADAVRNAGDGDVDKGAEVMYNMMKNLESGGDVSEESQGLSGARDMFQTSKRLEEVL